MIAVRVKFWGAKDQSNSEGQTQMADIATVRLKGGIPFPVDMDYINGPDFPVEIFRHIWLMGYEKYINSKGMSKLSVKDLEGEELAEVQDRIKAQAEKNHQDLCEGKVGRASRTGTKLPAAVKARAMQMATALAKDGIKRSGYKWGAYSAADKKEMALLILEDNPGLIDKARAQLEEQAKTVEEAGITVPEKFKRADAKAKPRKGNVEALAKARAKRKETTAHARQ